MLLRQNLKVEKFAQEVKGTRHLLVEPFGRVLGDLVVNLEARTLDVFVYIRVK